MVTVVGKAVSNASGPSTMMLSTQNSMWHTLSTTWEGKRILIETTALDDFFEREGWPRVHLVKLDVEGAELVAIEGMHELSRRYPDLRLIVEFTSGGIVAFGTSPKNLFHAIRDACFTRFFMILEDLVPVHSVCDIPSRLRGDAKGWFVNLLCQKRPDYDLPLVVLQCERL